MANAKRTGELRRSVWAILFVFVFINRESPWGNVVFRLTTFNPIIYPCPQKPGAAVWKNEALVSVAVGPSSSVNVC
jgi:hypothetical protein